jgi:hypothetical protein
MLKQPEEIVCRCGLKQIMRASYVLCASCNAPLLLPKKTHPKCYVRLKDGVAIATRLIEKGAVVEDVIVYGKFKHRHSVGDFLFSGFVPFYKRSDTPNVRFFLFGQKAKFVATVQINKGEEIQVGVEN